jgi:hypothetical protein
VETNGGRGPIDVQQFEDALKSKGANTPCPICQGTEWSTVTRFAVVPITEGSTLPLIDKNKGFEAYCSICDNCGFVRLIAAKTLLSQEVPPVV